MKKFATYYDTMTRFHERIPDETAMLKTWVERYQLRSVVDLACGTGLHAIILAQLGLQPVVGGQIYRPRCWKLRGLMHKR